MVDRQNVINGLQEAVDWLSTETSLTVVDQWVVRDALALLKAQEPVEPVMVNGEPECGACRYELRADADSYCPCCGRKVKWG